MATKGADLDEMFSFLSDAAGAGGGGRGGGGGGGGGRDELDFVDSINQDLDRMLGADAAPTATTTQSQPQKKLVTGGGGGGGVQDKKAPAGKQTTGKAEAETAAKSDKAKGKSRFKWKK